MRVFFGFGDAQILVILFGKHIGEDVFEFFGREQIAQPGPGLFILGHGHEGEIFWARWVAKFLEIGFDEGAGGFAGAVGAEIEEDHGVIVADYGAWGCGLALRGFRVDDGGNDKFVGDAFLVAGADGGDEIGEFRIGVAVNHGTVRFFDALPAIVAVHGVVAADDGGDLADAVLAHFLFEGAQEINAAIRRGVAAVHEAVDEDARDFVFRGPCAAARRDVRCGSGRRRR